MVANLHLELAYEIVANLHPGYCLADGIWWTVTPRVLFGGWDMVDCYTQGIVWWVGYEGLLHPGYCLAGRIWWDCYTQGIVWQVGYDVLLHPGYCLVGGI